jgi:hypothetical protein
MADIEFEKLSFVYVYMNELLDENDLSTTKRMTIEFGGADLQELKFLNTEFPNSQAELIRKSVRFHGKIQRRIAAGAKLFFENPDGSIETILIL